MKLNLSLFAILSAISISSSAILDTSNPAQACGHSKANGDRPVTSINSPNLNAKKLDLGKLGIAGAGMAAVAGLFAAGISYKKALAAKTDSQIAEVPVESGFENLPPVPQPEENSTSLKVEKDLTAVG